MHGSQMIRVLLALERILRTSAYEVKRSFIRRALELATTASLVLGPQHWSAARLY